MTLPTRARMSRNRQIEVLLLDAHFRQALAATRSLSRAGVQGPVQSPAAFRGRHGHQPLSRWCSFAAVVPDFAEDAAGRRRVRALLDEPRHA